MSRLRYLVRCIWYEATLTTARLLMFGLWGVSLVLVILDGSEWTRIQTRLLMLSGVGLGALDAVQISQGARRKRAPSGYQTVRRDATLATWLFGAAAFFTAFGLAGAFTANEPLVFLPLAILFLYLLRQTWRSLRIVS